MAWITGAPGETIRGTWTLDDRISGPVKEVAFEIPAGTAALTVRMGHDSSAGVLDLGCSGPDGFRGWSGGAREGFMLTATHATPGYLAGRIDPGQWVLTLGPVVLNPIGMEWQAQVVLTPGVERSLRPSAPSAAAARPRRGAGWFRGDLHTHTVHSDGRRQITEMAEAATTADLDFIVSTDHNTNSANRAWAATPHQSLAVVAGEEVTTRHGSLAGGGAGPGRLGRLALRTARRRLRGVRRTGSRRRRPGRGRSPVGAAAGLRLGVRLSRRGRGRSMERAPERR
jgi:hypothetical protein